MEFFRKIKFDQAAQILDKCLNQLLCKLAHLQKKIANNDQEDLSKKN